MPDVQSVLHPAGVEAARIAREWWIFLGVCTVVWLIVAAVTLLALAKGRRAASSADSRVLGRNISVATAVTVVALIALLFEATATQGALESVRSPDPLRIQVTGNQWWWDIQYVDPVPSQRVTTANEIHIPVGRSVAIDLLATDVIHSLWIPNLQGKLDLIPGRLNQLWLRADRAGVYRGQCAEYCGLQHAKMALVVVAESPNDFERWLTANRAPAPAPATPEQRRGKDVVERGPCAMCHTVTGTLAGGKTAPDLTHVASRSTLAAGTLPNTPGYLAGWIVDPQHIKPGNRMPATALRGEELQAVLAYLETLK